MHASIYMIHADMDTNVHIYAYIYIALWYHELASKAANSYNYTDETLKTLILLTVCVHDCMIYISLMYTCS